MMPESLNILQYSSILTNTKSNAITYTKLVHCLNPLLYYQQYQTLKLRLIKAHAYLVTFLLFLRGSSILTFCLNKLYPFILLFILNIIKPTYTTLYIPIGLAVLSDSNHLHSALCTFTVYAPIQHKPLASVY